MAAEKLCFLMTSSAWRQPKDQTTRVHSVSDPLLINAFIHRQTNITNSVYLIGFKHSSYYTASGKYVNPDVNVSLSALDPTVVPHTRQILLCPVVVGKETITGIEKHPVTQRFR